MKIKLTEQQLNNLKVFLNRVDLKGQEAVEFAVILQAINNAKEDSIKEGEE